MFNFFLFAAIYCHLVVAVDDDGKQAGSQNGHFISSGSVGTIWFLLHFIHNRAPVASFFFFFLPTS